MARVSSHQVQSGSRLMIGTSDPDRRTTRRIVPADRPGRHDCSAFSRRAQPAASSRPASASGRRRRARARRRRVVLHDVVPVDDAATGRADLDADPALQHVVELGRDVHVAALTGAVLDAHDRQAAAHADRAVTLEDVRLDEGRQLVALDAQLGDLALDLGHALARRLAVLGDRIPQRLHVGGAVGQQLLLGLDGLDELGDLALARGQALAALLDLTLRRHVLLRVLGLRQLVLRAGHLHLVVRDEALLLGVVALGLLEGRALRGEQRLDARQVRLGRRELRGYGLERLFQFLNLGVVSLKLLELLKLIAQSRILRVLQVRSPCGVLLDFVPDLLRHHNARRSWAHLDSNQGPGGYEPPALTAELWAQPCTETRCTKEGEIYTARPALSSRLTAAACARA